ncbi:MAG: carboxylating nicotinate-nucleotide diphosphorylase [Gammaproteobacteria bacterium]
MNNSWELNKIDHELIGLALKEDLGMPYKDVTTNTLFKHQELYKSAKIFSKHAEDIIVAGLPIIGALFDKMDAEVKLTHQLQDGDILSTDDVLVTLESDINSLLMIERTLLNFLRHLCAIATLTKKFVNLVKDTKLKILDTRKTSPGMRHLEKYAVHCGGGVNHRMGLYDAFMLKDNHVDFIGGLQKALAALPDKQDNPLEVICEIRNLDELRIALEHGHNKITRVLFDNMTHKQLKSCVEMVEGIFETEASGNISLRNIKDIAQTGVDYASIGMLTYAAGQVDLSMIVGDVVGPDLY